MNTIKVLKKKKIIPPPIWIMRQAGRYLPEFQKTKKKIKGFYKYVVHSFDIRRSDTSAY